MTAPHPHLYPVPEPAPAADAAPPPAWEDGELDPILEAMLAAADRLVDDLGPEAALAAAADLYFDADGMPQLRRARIRAVR